MCARLALGNGCDPLLGDWSVDDDWYRLNAGPNDLFGILRDAAVGNVQQPSASNAAKAKFLAEETIN